MLRFSLNVTLPFKNVTLAHLVRENYHNPIFYSFRPLRQRELSRGQNPNLTLLGNKKTARRRFGIARDKLQHFGINTQTS